MNTRLSPLLTSRVRPAVYLPEANSPDNKKGQPIQSQIYLDGEEVNSVLLDSVPSQANRMEQALYELRQDLKLPDVLVRFPDGTTYSQWQLSHRIYDALIRDSRLNGQPFFETDPGKKLATGDPQALFNMAPNVLIFGGWNSHAQKGIGHTRAARIERAITSEILGLNPKSVYRTESRLDPTGIPGDMPLPSEYEKIKEDLVGSRSVKKMSQLGLGNVAPSASPLDVSIEEARHLVAITSTPWKRLGLPEEAQEVLFHLALLGLALLYEKGLYLRSGTQLIPCSEPRLLNPLTGEEEPLPSSEELLQRIQEGLEGLPQGYSWEGKVWELIPSEALLEAYQGKEEVSQKKGRKAEREG